ncbi:MAG TPA: N-acetylglucosamine-6-phosphate deacetylase [Bryobacteraceae bacterium]|nr:N-acetylglucosamine-6-phosphate deacetylase [Bryobacteraceae bacterium]
MATVAWFNGILVSETGLVKDGLLVAREGRIAYAGARRDELIPPGAERIDAGGKYIAPGFLDIHVHGGGGADFMDADPEPVFRYHSMHGTTALCPTTCAAPLDEILSAVDAVEHYRSGGEQFGRALGVHLEGPYFAATKKGCHLPEQVRPPEEREWRLLLERGGVARMTLAPELPGAQPLIEALCRAGAVASAGHSEALYPEMMDAADWGVTHTTHIYCVMTDALNNRCRGTAAARHGGIVEAIYLDDRLTTEVIADGIHLTAELLRMPLKIKGCENVAIVTDALRGAGMPEGDYTFGPRHGLMATVKNREARVKGGVGLASSVCPMDEMVRITRDLTGCPLWQAVRMASLTPAEIIGCADELGSLAAGKRADVLIFDEDVRIAGVYLGGRRLEGA